MIGWEKLSKILKYPGGYKFIGGPLDKKIKHLLKTLVTIGLLSYVIYSANLAKIFDVLKKINFWIFLLVILIGVFSIALSAKKWQILLEVKGEKRRFKDVLKVYYIGIFFNMFFPTTIGGDVIKAHEMSKTSKKKVEAYSSVFMERFTGAIAILLLAIVATTIYFNNLPMMVIFLVYCVFTPLLLIIIVVFSRKKFVKKFRRLYSIFFQLFARFSLKKKVEKLYDSISLYGKEKKCLLIVLLVSLSFQSITIILRYILSKAIGMDVPLYYFFIFIPICSLIAFLPISIRGIGIFEFLYMYFFTMVGATAAEAVSLAFLTHILAFINSTTGGVIYLFSKKS
jgi:uncharacterized protein (TIRG00374 family)